MSMMSDMIAENIEDNTIQVLEALNNVDEINESETTTKARWCKIQGRIT